MIPRPSRSSTGGTRKSSIPTASSSRKNYYRTPQTQKRFSQSRSTLSSVKGNARGSYINQSESRMKDARPLNDKEYMKKSILNLINVLRGLNFHDPINTKSLNPPTNKTYQIIFQFLVSIVLGEYRILGKPEEAMLQTLKVLGYPYGISKSTLANVGTMSAWPQSLGVLTWILTLIEYKVANGEEIVEIVQSDPRKNWRRNFMTSAYTAFMQGDDGPYNNLLQVANEELDQLDKDSHKTLKELKQANESLMEECQRKNKEKSECDGLEGEITSVRGKLDQYNTYFQQIEEYLKIKTAKTSEVLNSIEERKLEILKIKELITQIKSVIAQQEINPRDLEHLTFKKNQMKQSIETLLSKTKLLNEKGWNVEIECSTSCSKMEDLVGQLNHKMKTVKSMLHEHILPLGLPKRPDDDLLHLSIGHANMESNAQQLITNIKPYSGSLNKKLLSCVGEMETENQSMSIKLMQDKEQLQDYESERKKLQQEFDELEAELHAENKEASSQEIAFNSGMKKKRDNLNTLKIVESQSISGIEEKVLSAQNELKRTIHECEKQEKEYLDCIVEKAKVAKSFREKTVNLIQDVKNCRKTLILKAHSVNEDTKKDLNNIAEKCRNAEKYLKNLTYL